MLIVCCVKEILCCLVAMWALEKRRERERERCENRRAGSFLCLVAVGIKSSGCAKKIIQQQKRDLKVRGQCVYVRERERERRERERVVCREPFSGIVGKSFETVD